METTTRSDMEVFDETGRGRNRVGTGVAGGDVPGAVCGLGLDRS